MTNDEIIDNILPKLYEGTVDIGYHVVTLLKKDKKCVRQVIEIMEFEGIAEVTKFPIVKIKSKGIRIHENSGWLEHRKQLEIDKIEAKEREDHEFEKSKVDFQLAKKMLKDYPKTRRRAKISYYIAGLLALFEIGQLLWPNILELIRNI